MSKKIPWKALFLVGFLMGAGVVAAVTFAPGDAGKASDSVPYGAPDGMNATVEGETNVRMETDVLFPSSDTVALETEDGNVTFQASGPAWATVHKDNITGTYTNVTEIDATQNNITINPEDKRSITVGQNIDRIEFQDAGIDNGNVDFVYAGSSGQSTVVVNGSQANTQIGAIDATHGGLLDVTTTDGSGTATFTALDNSEHAVKLQTSDGPASISNMSPDGNTLRYENQTLSVDVSDPDYPNDNVTLQWYVDGNLENTTTANSAGTHTATVGPFADGTHDWHVETEDRYGQTGTSDTKSYEIEHHTPQVSDIDPSGKLDYEPSQLSAQVNDTDFAKDGDELTVAFVLDGTSVGTDTLQSNGTASVSMPQRGQTGGGHNIEVNVDDDWGNSNSDTGAYDAPDTLFIRDENNFSKLVPADGQVRFFGNDELYSRSAPNGYVNLTGLPVNEEFNVEIEPTDGNYTTRTVYLESIYEQESVYLLNTTSTSTVESRFTLEDPTGNYGPSSLLKIQKPITDKNNNITYQTIVADEFGVEGVTATLDSNQRYRLSVVSDGNSQIVGPYRADTSETVAVEPGSPTISVGEITNGRGAAAALDNRTLEYKYTDEAEQTDKLIIWIHERGNESNQLQANSTHFDLGNHSGIATLTANESEKEWAVNFVIDRNGNTEVLTRYVSNTKDLTLPIDGGWQLVIGVSLILLFAGAFSVLNAGIGAVVVALVGGVLWYIGLLGNATTGAAVALAIFISVVSYIYKGAY